MMYCGKKKIGSLDSQFSLVVASWDTIKEPLGLLEKRISVVKCFMGMGLGRKFGN